MAAELIGWGEEERNLSSEVQPFNWVNPKPRERYDLVVVSGGKAGLVAALSAARPGVRVALVERRVIGDECLETGFAPERTMLRIARAAHVARGGARYGVHTRELHVDFTEVMACVRHARSLITPEAWAEQVTRSGIGLFLGDAHFVNDDTLGVAGARLGFARAIVATGTRPVLPSLEGLDNVGYFTSETVFSLRSQPLCLVVLGGDSIGCELAQAFARLGSSVTLIESGERLLPRADPRASKLIQRVFERESIRVLLRTELMRVETLPGESRRIHYETGLDRAHLDCDAILVALGRAPNVSGLGLDTAGIDFDRQGVRVDDRLRTTNPRVYAAGDVCSGYEFTPAAASLARVAAHNALSITRRSASTLITPSCTYTDPAVAEVGLGREEARELGAEALSVRLCEGEFPVGDSTTQGFASVYYRGRRGMIGGAALVSASAGELVTDIVLAMRVGLGLAEMGRAVVAHPSESVLLQRLSEEFMRTRPRRGPLRWFGLRKRASERIALPPPSAI